MADGKRYVGTSLDDETYLALIRMATKLGRHPTDLIKDYVSRGILMDTEMMEEGTVPPELRVFYAFQKGRAEGNVRAMLRSLAGQLLSSPDENRAEELRELCASVGLTVEEIMREAQDTASVAGASISFEEDGSAAQIRQFLLDLFRSTTELSAKEVYARGGERGFSPSQISRAKNELGIQATRKAKGWFWLFPVSQKIPNHAEVTNG